MGKPWYGYTPVIGPVLTAPWGSRHISEAQQQEEIKGIRQTVATYGKVVPIVFGTTRIAPNVIWFPPEGYWHDYMGPDLLPSSQKEVTTAILGLALCEGPIVGIGAAWKDGAALQSLSALNGTYGLPDTSGFPAYSIQFGGVSNHWDLTVLDHYVGTADLNVLRAKYSAYDYNRLAWICQWVTKVGSALNSLPNQQFEVRAAGLTNEMVQAGVIDANAADVMSILATDAVRGCGWAEGRLGDLGPMRNYAGAMGFGISWALEEQRPAVEWMQTLLDAVHCAGVESGGKVKVVPYGDSDVMNESYSYTANHTPVYDLDDDDFITYEDEQPIRIERTAEEDVYNVVPVEYLDRRAVHQTLTGAMAEAGYEKQVAEAPVMSDVFKTMPGGSKKGYHKATPIALHCFSTQEAAQARSRLYAQRSVAVRNRYTFRVSWKFILLEKMDLIGIASPLMGLTRRIVRVVSRRRDRAAGAQGEIEIVAEDAPFGTYTTSAYVVDEGESAAGVPNAVPLDSYDPVIFMPPRAEPDGNHYVWVATAGGAEWGGCHVYYSWDGGGTYRFAGDIVGRCTYGATTAPLDVGAPLDVTNTLSVELTAGALPAAVSDTDRDNLLSACWVDNEIIAYSAAVNTTGSSYNLTGLRRGCANTLVEPHLTARPFVLMNSAPCRIAVPNNRRGCVLSVKLVSYNIGNVQTQDLASVGTHTFTIPGLYKTGNLPIVLSWDDFDREDWFLY